jgi:hypothetical protein
MLAAWRGNQAEALELIGVARQEATARGQGMALSMVEGANAVLGNGLGHYDEAFAAAQRACAQDELSLHALTLVELIEAAVRTNRPTDAATALERLSERTRASGTEFALGLEARSRALLTDGPSAEPLYEEAVKRLAHGRLAPHLARAQLVYGEWLRRENRRADAREQLRAAHDTFSRIGAKGFAERTRRELSATGETAQAQPGHARRPHRPGGADRPSRPRRPLQPRDRRTTVPQPADGPVPPGQGLRQARRHLAQPARPRSRQPPQPGLADVARGAVNTAQAPGRRGPAGSRLVS